MDDRVFTTEQLIDATGLSPDHVRRLITWGALVPLPGSRGRGHSRTWEIRDVQHAACVAAINNAGFGLKLAHTLAYLQVLRDLFALYDPRVLAMNAGDKDGWFSPSNPIPRDDGTDLLLDVCNGRFLYCGSKEHLQPIGQINESRTEYASMIDFATVRGGQPIWIAANGKPAIAPDSLSWRFIPSMDDKEFHRAFGTPITKISINLSLAMRIAVRRALELPTDYPPMCHGDAS
jgi:hypothetical protein